MEKRTAWQIQRAVLFALLVRELRTRFGKKHFGYWWILIEPILHITLWSTIFFFASRTVMDGFSVPVFIITGVIPWLFFKSCIDRATNAVSANQNLFAYRQVKPFDALLARFLLELALFPFVYITLLLGAAWLGFSIHIHNLLQLLTILILFTCFSCGCSFVVGVLCTKYSIINRVLPFALRPLYFLSGIIFPISRVAEPYQTWLSWNPILQAIELSRDAYVVRATETPQFGYEYFTLWTIGVLFLGIALYRYHSQTLLVRA